LETAMNYLQNKDNTCRCLLRTSLYYRMKHNSLKMLQLLYHSLMSCQTTIHTFIIKVRHSFVIKNW